MTTFHATVFFLIHVYVLISFSFSTRQYATDLSTLITALRHTEAIITPLPISQQTTRRQLMKPILALPFDLEQFQKHLLHNWTTYYGEKQISTMTKPLNVTPDCNCYNYYRVKWKPDQWTILRRDPIMSFLDFEMINLKLIKQSFYLIPHIHAALPPYHMHLHNSFDALMFISQIISYFYEKYEFVRFKLFYHHIAWAHKYSGPCFLNIQDFPLVITNMYGPTPRYDGSFDYDEVSHHCPSDTLTKLQQYNATEYRIFFPKGILRNVLARLRLRSQYLKDFEYLEALDFEWGFPNDTGYVLRVQATTLRLEIPKNWWIHQQSPSLLGYHKHFFAPSYLQTIRTTYSYERRRRHYYNNGLYVKKPKTQYLAQRVDEVKQNLISWPLPRHRINCKLNHRKYCSPRCGELEYYMLFAYHLIPGNENQTFIAPCINYVEHFTTDRFNINKRKPSRRKEFLSPDWNSATHAYVRILQRKHKLSPLFRGPFPILERQPRSMLLDIDGNLKRVSYLHLHPVRLRTDETVTRDSQLLNNDVTSVSRPLNHEVTSDSQAPNNDVTSDSRSSNNEVTSDSQATNNDVTSDSRSSNNEVTSDSQAVNNEVTSDSQGSLENVTSDSQACPPFIILLS